ncbi:MAG TPA: tRNA (adenosine(37)-N6)-threonylcarbamoyltransferase complex transferase subunit TsaD [Clostridiales bacterium]|nr:MAG: tRNA (adenosine(37)-N6)-threonylcarbamoyltransferase complex transferase subunit TsaD [Clostridiales bacterium GWD2_32_59]HAN09806.1 tRNA (adenosine(37)-N6)-threonylcarbamoyltransferase complex transferase subunit TsaD [Clostridiales bacterium]
MEKENIIESNCGLLKDIIILGIETSCDETSAAVVRNGRDVLSNVIYSQIDIHKEYGGVVPEIASRKHVEKINKVIEQALVEANVTYADIDAVAVTCGPGLVGALLVGLSAAKAIAYIIDKPLIGVNHIDGHISANYIEDKACVPPFICLVISGGHSNIVHVKDYGVYEVLGTTRDDAIGEAYDKVARVLGLGYPGGPLIDKAAKEGNEDAINFPRTYLESDSLDFSFSGIKSAVINYINTCKMKGLDICVPDVAASFQKAVVEVATFKAIRAAEKKGISKIALAGGVAANTKIREMLGEECLKKSYTLIYPKMILCTDNAAMIAAAGYNKYIKGEFSELTLNASPNLKF